MAHRTSSVAPQGAAAPDAPQLTRIDLFPTPLVIATMPDADALNPELKRVDPCSRGGDGVGAAFQPRRLAVDVGTYINGWRTAAEGVEFCAGHRRRVRRSTAPASGTSSRGG